MPSAARILLVSFLGICAAVSVPDASAQDAKDDDDGGETEGSPGEAHSKLAVGSVDG